MHILNTTESLSSRSQGADVLGQGVGVRYRTWCEQREAEVLLVGPDGHVIRTLALEPEGDGYFSAVDAEGRAGDLYRYRLGRNGSDFPDPASRFQPFGVHGPSLVVDPRNYAWSDSQWGAPDFSELIIYELHIGTFTPEGTFRAAITKLDHLVALGVTAIEIMPIADFPGDRNWGYDGVSLYAPARIYGQPDDVRAFVDAAHKRALAVILDVVYNHLGPDGNYIGAYHRDYWNPRRKTPWGDALNYGQPAARSFFTQNPIYWMREYHIDGFRLDATHAIEDDSEAHILAEIAARIHDQGGFLVAEDERNEPRLLQAPARGGLGLDGCWADDFHHIVRVMLTGERESYYANFKGTAEELADVLTHGWLYRGQVQSTTGKPRGGAPVNASPQQFIYCVSNHDQVGNRAYGERLGHQITPAAYRAACALLCLVPQTPMLFMGQEWNASSPFQFFTSHNRDLGSQITEGRRQEFRHFAAFRESATLETIPDPQAESTFVNSKLRWEEIAEPSHTGVLALHREFLLLRRTHPAFRARERDSYGVVTLENGIVAIIFGKASSAALLVLTDLVGGHASPDLTDRHTTPDASLRWQPLFSSNEERFGGGGLPPFQIPTTLVLEAR